MIHPLVAPLHVFGEQTQGGSIRSQGTLHRAHNSGVLLGRALDFHEVRCGLGCPCSLGGQLVSQFQPVISFMHLISEQSRQHGTGTAARCATATELA